MIPCHVCGKDSLGGWSIGYPPAPDSQKMGLCKEHDLALHRELVQRAWHELLVQQLDENTRNEARKIGGQPRLLSIYFNGGGSISLPCSALTLLENNTLKALTPDGEDIFFPLVQVRNYALTPLLPAPQPARRIQEAQPPLKNTNLALPEQEGGALPDQTPDGDTESP